jgi:hypothetical protein
MAVKTDFDPVAYMKSKGFSAHQEISATSGYTGTFTPEVIFGHWTASYPGSDTSKAAVRDHHYASCTNRSGHTAFGGYKVRQGHGGEGRTQPMDEARRGQMNASRWQSWINSGQGDNTSSQPNQYGMSFCIDCTVDENVSLRCVDAWLASGAMWLAQSGLSTGYAMCHSVSTSRKIDIDYLIVDGSRWGPTEILNRLEYWRKQFTGGAPPSTEEIKMYAAAAHPVGDGYAIVKPDGGVYNFNSPYYGSAAGHIVAGEKAVDMAWHPDGKGYWVLSSGGRIYSFGSARYYGGIPDVLKPGVSLNKPTTNISPTKDGKGYYISANDGGLFCFGNAVYRGTIATEDAKN